MKFNGIDPRTLHKGISIAKEIPPGAPASKLETLMGTSGEIVIGRNIQQGEYVVRINIAGKSRQEAWQIRALIAAWARAADDRPRKLIPTQWPEVYYEAILKEISPPEFVHGFAVVEVTFTLPRPVAVSNTRQTWSAEEGDQEPITIGGTTWTRPEIGVYMHQAEGLSIAIDGKTNLRLSGSYDEGDNLFVYTNPPQVQLMQDGQLMDINDRIDYAATDFEALCRALSPGEHTVQAVGASVISVTWRDEWL